MAARGTPDDTGPGTTPCNTRPGSVRNTGSNAGCVSAWGAFDMVGNVEEWVADWVPSSTACPGWGGFSDDAMCLSGASTAAQAPGTLVRGGSVNSATFAGPLAVDVELPVFSISTVGFRGAR